MSSAFGATSGYATPAYEKKEPMTLTQEVSGSEEDLSGVHRPESLDRPVLRLSPFIAGASICLGICLLGGVYIGKLVREVVLDGNWVRLALIAPVPLLFMISLFFFQTIFSSLFQMIGPIGGAFTKDGAIGSVGEKVGGPLASDGMIGKNFNPDGTIGGSVQNALGGEKKQ